MDAIRSVKNQYPGINAHLHSTWQGVRGWHTFHNPHLAYLLVALRAQLLPMGYTVGNEDALQIRRIDEYRQEPESDLTIYDPDPARFAQTPASPARNTTGVVLPLPVARLAVCH